jgi:cardiolipin synthase A/B
VRIFADSVPPRMEFAAPNHEREKEALSPVHALARQAFSRAAGVPLIEGNQVRLLTNAAENYPAWLDAIGTAKRYIHFENYIIHGDAAGRMFADALTAKALEGVRVRLLYDWLGCCGKVPRGYWERLRAAGVEVRCYNPPRWGSPLGWLSRDHRKTVSVDGEIAFVAGLCIGSMWLGDAEKKIEPWRDTGVELRGPAVASVERAFAEVWATIGDAIPESTLGGTGAKAGAVALRVMATVPATAGMLRVNELVAALASERLWVTDPYFAGTPAYVGALRSAAKDGVDVRLLVPDATDIPLLKPLSRAGYRTLLEAGVRVFEWNGSMIHAKTAVADTRWARVGSSNLNIASWFGNCELDILVEDEAFAGLIERSYLRDLENATELVLDARAKLRAPHQPSSSILPRRGRGSVGRAAAGAIRIGNTVGASFANRRVMEPVEARITTLAGVFVLALSVLFAVFPRVLAYPLVFVGAWTALSLLWRGYQLQRAKSRREELRDQERPR